MARDHTRIRTDIWGDDDWLDLSPQAQHLYLVLTTQPTLSFCGSGDWQPKKIAARAAGWTADQVCEAGAELQDGLFLLLDLDTDEFLIRSWIKHDTLYRVQNMAVSMANARGALASRKLRAVVVHEVLKLRDSEPNLESWKKDAVVKMLAQKALDPSTESWASPWVRGKASPSVSPKDVPEASPSDSGRATPSPSPAPNSSSSTERPRKRGTRLPEGWEPEESVIRSMREERPDVDLRAEHRKFVDHWTAKAGKDGVKLDWNATWRNWIRNARPSPHMQAAGPNAGDVKVNDWLALANQQQPHLKAIGE